MLKQIISIIYNSNHMQLKLLRFSIYKKAPLLMFEINRSNHG